MVVSKFGIGQQVRHKLLGCLGVIIDVDAEYALTQPKAEDISGIDKLRFSPWYHVIIEDEAGQAVHTYWAEAQLSIEPYDGNPEQPSLDELAQSIRHQLQTPRLRN